MLHWGEEVSASPTLRFPSSPGVVVWVDAVTLGQSPQNQNRRLRRGPERDCDTRVSLSACQDCHALDPAAEISWHGNISVVASQPASLCSVLLDR